MKLKLEQYILGLLIFNPLTGYGIKKDIDTERRFVRTSAPLSQIYNTLKRMADDGLVTFTQEKREGKPDLKIYSITPQGKRFLIEFLSSPIIHTFRFSESNIMFRVKYAFLVEIDVIIKHLQSEIDFRRKQIREFRHRDRTVRSKNISESDLAYVNSVNDQIHSYGSARMDLYVDRLHRLLAFFENKKPS